MKKYELYRKEGNLWRIRALKDFGDVKKGDLGGLVQAEDNLSLAGNCWVYGNARVSGCATVHGNAKVRGNAVVYGNVKIFGNAVVYGNTWIYGNAEVYDDAEVYDNAVVCDWVRVCGNARVYGNAWVYNDAIVCGNATISDEAEICDEAVVYDWAVVGGGAKVCGEQHVTGNNTIVEKEIITKTILQDGSEEKEIFTQNTENNNFKLEIGRGGEYVFTMEVKFWEILNQFMIIFEEKVEFDMKRRTIVYPHSLHTMVRCLLLENEIEEVEK